MKKLLLILMCIPFSGVSQAPVPMLPSSNIFDDKLSIGSGCVSGDCINGYGTFIWENGDKCVGEWKNLLVHEIATLTFGKGEWEGDKYSGEWENDKKHGLGTYTWNSGAKYG